MIRDQYYETMPREDLEALQLRRLQAVVERVYHLVPFYRRRMDEAGGSNPRHIRTLADLRPAALHRQAGPAGQLPLRHVRGAHGPDGADSRLVRHHRQAHPRGLYRTGTWTPGRELMARALAAAGAHRGDIVHVAYGYGLFTGGLGVHYGAERLGAAVIPVSGGQTRRQIMLIQDFGPTVLCCTPSFALYLAEVGQEMGVDFAKTQLRVGIFGAEPWTEGMRARDRKAPQPRRPGHLRPVRDHRPRRGHRVPRGQGRPPHLRGPLPAGDHQPGDPGAPAARGDRRAGHHHPHQGGLPADALPHPGPHLPELRPLHLRPHHRPHAAASRAGATTCSSSAGSTSSRPRSSRC